MKSRSLLPGRDDTEPDEEFVGWEERDVLLARLLELRTYAALSDAFVSLLERAARAYPRLRGIDDGFVVAPPDLLAGVTTAAWSPAPTCAASRRSPCPSCGLQPRHRRRGLGRRDGGVAVPAPAASMGHLSFRELTESLGSRIEVIVHFLALLELCKLGHVELGPGLDLR